MNKYKKALDNILQSDKKENGMWTPKVEDIVDEKDIKTIQELVERATPMKVSKIIDCSGYRVTNKGRCPNKECTGSWGKRPTIFTQEYNYCPDCGQKLIGINDGN